MVWYFSGFSLFGLIASVLCGSLAVYAWRHRQARSARSFFALLLVLALWSVVYGVQLGAEQPTLHALLQGLTLGIAGFVPTVWIVFVLAHLRIDGWLSRRRLGSLMAEPILFFVLAVTNGVHETVWTSIQLETTAMGVIGQISFGPLYYVHIVYAYGLVAVGMGLVAVRALRVPTDQKPQHALLLLAVVPPFVGHVTYTLHASPMAGLDTTPFVFAISAIVFGFAIFRFALLDRSRLARQRALAEMGDGVIVVDEDGRVEDINAIARRVLDPTLTVGDTIDAAFATDDVRSLDGQLVENEPKEFDLRVWPLQERDETVGYTLVLRDVTDLHTYQQQLEVSSRILRHNLRNGMTVIAGHARNLERTVAHGQAEHARAIRQRAEELMETAEKARRMTSSVDPTRRKERRIDLVSFLDERRERFAGDYPDVEFLLQAPDDVAIRTENREALSITVDNLLENAAEHNDATDPRVTITVQSRMDDVLLEFADNGSGIPEMELDVLDRGEETPVVHGEGIGLWLAYWGARASGGTISFASATSGSAVTLTYPRAGSEDGGAD